MEELTTWGMRFVGEEFHNDESDQIMMRRIAAAVALLLSASPELASTQGSLPCAHVKRGLQQRRQGRVFRSSGLRATQVFNFTHWWTYSPPE